MLRKPDLSILGESISSLPPSLWEDRMLFSGAPDIDLRSITSSFPATMRKDKTTHPLFVLKSYTTGNFVCPCSTKGKVEKQRYIRQGCKMAKKDFEIDKNSFLVEACSFTLPMDKRFSGKLRFMGVVPTSCIEDKRCKP